MSKVIGCDLGTTNSVIAISSVVGSHDDQIIVCSPAVDRRLSAPENTEEE